MATKSCFEWFYSLCSVIFIIANNTKCSATNDDRKVYIVYMGSFPEGEYSPLFHHLSILQEAINTSSVSDHLVRSYTKSFNGFAARLTSEEQEKIARMEGVVSVFPSRTYQVQTTRSWDFMGLSETVSRVPTVESDVIIGVFDTGIWLQSESFNDKGFGPPPNKWKGICQGDKQFTCNNKVIGARYYNPYERNPTDRNGHGTHTASTAAGNIVKRVSFYGLAAGNARGGVPSARIAVYKICNDSGSCAGSNVLAAFDDAIDDGVDIITASLALVAEKLDFHSNSLAIGAFHALEKGILTTHSAGNFGPYLATLASVAPWLLSVAASSTDRRIIDKVVLGDGMTLIGKSINPFKINGAMFPLVYGKDASAGCDILKARNIVKGKIVLCDRPRGLLEAFRAHALGAVLLTNRYGDGSAVVPIPAVVLSRQLGMKVKSYLNSTKVPQANIMKSETVKDFDAPVVASFSSRGPNAITKDIIKPDITAPGVNILAAFSPIGDVSGFSGSYKGKLSVNYSIASGTSMSCPHAAGAAAYVKTFHPQWSPSAIKSALMTTARRMSGTKNPDREFSFGAGHIDPVRAVNPGLVYDATTGDYIKMLCNIGYGTKRVRAMSRGKNISCPDFGKRGTPRDLNYPSMAAYLYNEKPFKIRFPRTVTNVGLAKSTYKSKVSAEPGINVKVVPQVLSFNSLGERQSFVVIVSGKGFSKDSMVSGSLVWSDGIHIVRSPIIVYKKLGFSSKYNPFH